MKRLFLSVLSAFAVATAVSCASTTESGEVGADRRQFLLPMGEINQMAAQEYDKMKSDARAKGTLDRNAEHVRRVQAVLQRLIPRTATFRKDAPGWAWEAHVIDSPEINAFCMPGGKIVFYSGIIDKLSMTNGEMAAVMGHEIAHALREHGRERMSEEVAKQMGLSLLVMTGVLKEKWANAAAIVGAVAISLPHSRGQETEADELGLELMARAGYDPHEALSLWKKMADKGGSKPPEILSSHPADQKRLQRLEALLPKVLPLYQRGAQISPFPSVAGRPRR